MKNRFKFLSGLALALLCLACNPELLRVANQTDYGNWKYPPLKGIDTTAHHLPGHTMLLGNWSLFLNTVMHPECAVVKHEERVNLYVWATCGHTWRLHPMLLKVNPPLTQIAG
jgi:hypothetical protein